MRGFPLMLLLAGASLLSGCRSPRRTARPAFVPARAAAPEADAPTVRDFGYVRALKRDGGGWQVTIQYADMLRGEEARRAAIADRAIGTNDDLEDDYYIRETDQTGAFRLAGDAVILRLSESRKADRPLSVEQLADAVNGKAPALAHLADAPYWFTLSGSRVVRIEQQFVP